MLRLLEFLYQNRINALFVLFQVVCFWLISSYNYRYNTYYLNSSNAVAGSVMATVNSVENYFDLDVANADLAEENLQLRRLLARQNRQVVSEKTVQSDSFEIVMGEVVNASHLKTRNYLTMRVKPDNGVKPGMGVMSADGVIGRVKSVSDHFATVTTILNPNLMLSGRVNSNQALCTVQWDGTDPVHAEVKYLPRHLRIARGDTIVTSGFGAIFPTGIPIGVLDYVDLPKSSPFYSAKVRLFTDFTRIQTAYVVIIPDADELMKLEEELANE